MRRSFDVVVVRMFDYCDCASLSSISFWNELDERKGKKMSPKEVIYTEEEEKKTVINHVKITLCLSVDQHKFLRYRKNISAKIVHVLIHVLKIVTYQKMIGRNLVMAENVFYRFTKSCFSDKWPTTWFITKKKEQKENTCVPFGLDFSHFPF